MTTRIVVAALVILVAMLVVMPMAKAATEAERLLKQEIDRREQERRDRRWEESHTPSAPLPSQPAPTAPGAHDGGPCFSIQRITLHPEDVLSARKAETLLAPYQGRCLKASDLAALQQALNSLALSQGLVTTRVVVPEQNLASGELRLEVWPGVLEALQAPDLTPRELTMVSALHPGELLQLRALEQTVDNLNRLASFKAGIDLLPGEKPGASVARLTVARSRPWQAAVAWQGEALNGEENHTFRASLTADGLADLADRLVLGLNSNLRDAQVDDAKGGSIDYDLPRGWWRFSAGADRFDYQNLVNAGLTTFTASGISRSWRIEAARTLHRDTRNRVSLALHGKRRLNDNFIEDVTIGVSTTRISVAGLRTDFSRVAAPWVWDASLDVETGEGRSPARYSPIDHHYTRLLGHTRLEYYFEHASLSTYLSGQWSDARLAPSEQFALTGIVQGFAPIGLNASTGLGLQVEVARPIVVNRAGLSSVRPALGVAAALAPHASGNPAREEIAATTASLTFPFRKALARVGLAYPLSELSSLDAPQGWQLDAGLSLQW